MYKIIIPVILLFSLSSCQGFLDREPIDQTSINTQLSTKKGITEALTGVYYKLRDIEFATPRAVYADLLSGNLTMTPNPSINAGVIDTPTSVENIYDFNDLKESSDLQYFYSGCYEAINNINLILSYIDEVPDASEAEKSQIKAEALSLRAFFHFSLYKIYSQNYTFTSDASHDGIVYLVEPFKVGVDYPGRKTAKETFELLYKDLDEALSHFQGSPTIKAGSKENYFSLPAAKTLYAEIALWKNDWNQAIKMSSEVIEESGVSLTPMEEFTTAFAKKETILEMPLTSNAESTIARIYNYTSATSFSEFAVSEEVLNLFSEKDARQNFFEKQLVKTKVGTSMQNLPYSFISKYKTETAGLLYRLTELYFIRAEASLRMNNSLVALSDINKIRARAGLKALPTLSLDTLLEEKRKEFVGENKYFFDLMRNHRNIVRTTGCISLNCNMNYPSNKFVAPIPYQSTSVNRSVDQNPDY